MGSVCAPLRGSYPAEKDRLIEHVESAGGKINWRALPDGGRAPYELNITYYSALEVAGDPDLSAQRFCVRRHYRCRYAGFRVFIFIA